MYKSIPFIALLLLSILFSCEKEEAQELPTYDCTGLTPTYTAEIKPIIDTNCATTGCHNSSSQAGGINLSTYALTSSESNNARFLGSIQHLSAYSSMPRNSAKLSDTAIQLIFCWVENGQPE